MSQPRTYRDYLGDILDAAERAERFCQGIDFDAFAANGPQSSVICRRCARP